MLDIFVCEDNAIQRQVIVQTVQNTVLIEELDMQLVLDTGDPYMLLEKLRGSQNTGIYFLDNFGARRKDRIFPAVRFSLMMATCIMLAGTILFQLIPGPLLAMFNANQDMYAIGIPCLRIISWSFVFAGISMILCSAFQALGHPGVSLGITLLRQLVLLIPMTAILTHLYGLDAGWSAFVITEVVCAILSILEWTRVKKQVDLQLA